MASWQRHCSFTRHARRTILPSPEASACTKAAAIACCVLVAAGCGHAGTPVAPAAPVAPASSATSATAAEPAAQAAPKAELFCTPSPEGYLRARLQGAIDADIDWTAPAVPQCLGGTRPQGDGLRLVYKGAVDGAPVLIVIGIASLPRSSATARHVATNVTVVREGAGEFYSTQGDDKCALDEARQEPVTGQEGRYRLTARGYCTQPARGLGGDGAVLVTRFDVLALVDHPRE